MDKNRIAGQRIREFREGMRISREEFSAEVGIGMERLKHIEDGTAKVKLEEVIAVNERYKISMDYLLGYCDDPHPTFMNETEAKIWNILTQLSAEELDEVKKEIERLKS